MLYDPSTSQYQFRADELRREAEHERLVSAAREARREERGTWRSRFLGRGRPSQDGNERVWVRAA
ncbi:hypothetical protein [Streptomyces sp. 891-h]|uniref:hypothetical protein n=1 Tax=unclassified Streptomyces TaxID=2593676 RepID=UPI001FAB1848|nr:hypothetical protein [Streptomyces sp. 891-h]UNZ17188.1 hypothetical protein HC362_09060 [Streptomyces sp. 891-h]